jgi:hypothetical protein
VLYLLHVADLLSSLKLRESDGDSAYADDTRLWVIANTLEEAQVELQSLANAMADFTRNNGLALNGAKTQLLIGGTADVKSFKVEVDGALTNPWRTLELLGVTFDRKLAVRPYVNNLANQARFQASRVARLAQHLRQLGSGLLMGKLAHALLVVAVQRLQGSTSHATEPFARVQAAINDVVRSVTGGRRDDHVSVETPPQVRQVSLGQPACGEGNWDGGPFRVGYDIDWTWVDSQKLFTESYMQAFLWRSTHGKLYGRSNL